LFPEEGKRHVSLRWEPGLGVALVVVMVAGYTWDTRMNVLRLLLDFERAHADELSVDFDILPLEAVNDAADAEV
jgi:hypothetical protein